MTYDRHVSVDRLSVTVPRELGAAMRTLARARRQTLSMLVTEGMAHQLRLASLETALAAADERFGALARGQVDGAEVALVQAMHRGQRKPRRARR